MNQRLCFASSVHFFFDHYYAIWMQYSFQRFNAYLMCQYFMVITAFLINLTDKLIKYK